MKNLQVETSLCYYQDDYQFKENFQNLREDTYVYLNYGNIKMPESLEDLYEISISNKKRKLIQFIREYSNYYPTYSNFDCIENVIADIFDMYSIDTIKDFIYDLEKFGIDFSPKFERYVSKGYSQGDAIEIFIPHSLAEVWGCSVEDLWNHIPTKEINTICWDSEINGSIYVSFDYEVKRETFVDTVELSFEYEFEYQEWSNASYEVKLDINAIIKYIDKKCYQRLDAESLEMIRKKLENIDYNDVEYWNK